MAALLISAPAICNQIEKTAWLSLLCCSSHLYLLTYIDTVHPNNVFSLGFNEAIHQSMIAKILTKYVKRLSPLKILWNAFGFSVLILMKIGKINCKLQAHSHFRMNQMYWHKTASCLSINEWCFRSSVWKSCGCWTHPGTYLYDARVNGRPNTCLSHLILLQMTIIVSRKPGASRTEAKGCLVPAPNAVRRLQSVGSGNETDNTRNTLHTFVKAPGGYEREQGTH